MSGSDLVCSEFWRQNCGADVFKKTPLSNDVSHVRNIVQGNGFEVRSAAAI